MTTTTARHLAAALACGLAALRAHAMVNPNFTPLHIEKQSRLICAARVAAIAADARSADLEIVETIKGEAGPKQYRVDFAPALAKPEDREKVEDAVACLRNAGAHPVFLSIGGATGEKESALLHAEGVWLRLSTAPEAGVLAFQSADSALNGTFNGGTDMLLHTMRFIRDFPAVNIMPAGPGITWTSHTKLAGGAPGATAVTAVDANDDGRLDLLVACPKGDKLLLNDAPDKWTEAPGLQAASAAVAWADFDGDGRPDLASLSAAGLKLHLQTAPGRFVPRDVRLPVPSQGEFLTLDAVDLGDGRSSLVAGVGQPVVLRNTDGHGAFAPTPLPEAGKATAPGAPGPCLAADLDGDGFADVLQVGAQNGTFWQGGSNGAFRIVPDCGARMGKARGRRVCVADLDGDGLPDVLLTGGGATPALLQNRGGGRFEESMRQTGEPGYIVQGGARCAAVGDFNGDAFPDLFVGYEDENAQFFFNRGFRSFAIAESLKFRTDDVEGCDQGQAAAAWVDADGDGAPELVTVLASGDIFLSRTSLGDVDEPRRIVVRLPPRAGPAGPVGVTFRMGRRVLASRVADRWGGPAVMAVPEPGRYTVEWCTPDGRGHTKVVDADRAKSELVLE